MLEELFGTQKPLIGVIHLLPLPGSARFDGHLEGVMLRAEQEAAALTTGGVNGIIVENFFDAPFTKGRVDTSTACAMALAVKRIMSVSELPVGVNVLRNDALTALAVAATTGARFIRVNVLTGAMLTDQGIIEGEAHALHLYRRQLMASKDVKILADVLVKHASPLAESDIQLIAKDTIRRGLADGLIVSGTATGAAPDMSDFRAVKEVLPEIPLFCGSGCTASNITDILSVADGAIVGTSLKRQGEVSNPVDVERVRALAKAAPKG
jgi:uncharacterized protein